MKTCTACRTIKPFDDFYDHQGGKMGVCKGCHKAAVRARARTNPAVQEYDRRRSKTPERRAHIQLVSKRWREEHPDAYKAQTAVGNAIRDGKLKKQPCEICGNKKVHGHHRNYLKPLEVTWLCARCHHRLHAVFPELRAHAS